MFPCGDMPWLKRKSPHSSTRDRCGLRAVCPLKKPDSLGNDPGKQQAGNENETNTVWWQPEDNGQYAVWRVSLSRTPAGLWHPGGNGNRKRSLYAYSSRSGQKDNVLSPSLVHEQDRQRKDPAALAIHGRPVFKKQGPSLQSLPEKQSRGKSLCMGIRDRRRVLTVSVCTSLFTFFFQEMSQSTKDNFRAGYPFLYECRDSIARRVIARVCRGSLPRGRTR